MPDTTLSDDYSLRCGGIERLYGRKALTAFRDAHIAVIGLELWRAAVLAPSP